MTREEIISGLKFTIEMFLLNPNTGETLTEPRNDMDKTTIEACKGAIKLLEQQEVMYVVIKENLITGYISCIGVYDHEEQARRKAYLILYHDLDLEKNFITFQEDRERGYFMSIVDAQTLKHVELATVLFYRKEK